MFSKVFKKAFSTTKLQVFNPYSNELVYETAYKSEAEGLVLLTKASEFQRSWGKTPLSERISVCQKFSAYISENTESIARDITKQMGKPLTQSLGEVKTMISRVSSLIEMAPSALSPEQIPSPSSMLQITREPVGVVLVISPWNYPLLTSVNVIITSILSGNTVLLKHSPYTPLCGVLFQEAFDKVGVPGLVNDCMVDLDVCQSFLTSPLVNYVSFTGSVQSGKFVYQKVAESNLIDVGLELGGKDAGYVLSDYNAKKAAESLIDGAMYNAGQSCCGIERIFVHNSIYNDFIEESTKLVNAYKLGDPFKEETTMGPLTLPQAPEILKNQIEDAINQGAKLICGGLPTTDNDGKGRFFEPTLVANAENDMNMMVEESFGPIIGVYGVDNDDEAIKLINESKYGLTAALYTNDKEKALKLGEQINVGTVFMNRCDYLDAKLPWSGRKLSGKGISLSKYGFHAVTKTKGYNFKI